MPQRSSWVHVLLLLLVAIGAVSTAVYIWTPPLRAEAALRTASLQQLQAATQRAPNDPRPFFHLGLRQLLLGQPGAAAQAFRRAADLDGEDEQSWLGAAEATAAAGDLQEGLGIAVTFSQRHPDNANGHLTIARIRDQQGALQHAYDEAGEASRLAPHDADAWRLLGDEATRLGKQQEAEQAFQQAVAHNPRGWRSRIDLGNLLIPLRRSAEATACFETAVRLAPDEALPPLLLGRQLLGQALTPTQVEAAHRRLLRSAEIQPNNAEVNHRLGISEMRMGRWNAARDYLERARRFDPADVAIASDLISAEIKSGAVQASQQETSRRSRLIAYQNEISRQVDEVKSHPNDPRMLLDLARLCARNGDDVRADQYYRLLLIRAPDQSAARQEWNVVQEREAAEALLPVSAPELTVLTSASAETPSEQILLRDAETLLAQRHTEEARCAFLSILIRHPSGAGACEGLARTMDAEGDPVQAVAYYERAVRLNPQLWQAQFGLGAHEGRTGRYKEAAQHYRQGLAIVPQNAAGWRSFGVMLADDPDTYQEAEAALSRAATLQPRNAAFLRDLAALQAKRHELSAAESNFRRALALAPQDADAQRDLAAFLIADLPTPALLQESARLLQSAQASASGDPMQFYWSGRLALQQGDARRAIGLLLQAAPSLHRMDGVHLWYSLSRAYQKIGDARRSEAALGLAERARICDQQITLTEDRLSNDPRNPELNLQLARLYTESGETAAATKQYERTKQLNPAATQMDQTVSSQNN